MERLGMENIEAHEQELTRYAIEKLSKINGMKIYGIINNHKPSSNTYAPSPNSHDAVVSFNVGNIHHMDMGTLLDQLGIAVRTGHHCAQPLMDRLGVLGTVRASFAMYNTKEEIDTLADGIERVSKMF